MIKRSLLFIFLTGLIAGGCVKSTIDLNRLSGATSLNPYVVISAVKGDVTLSNLVEPTDTLVFGPDNLLKFVYSLDSVIDYRLNDFYTPFPTALLDATFLPWGPIMENIEGTLIINPGDGIKLKEMDVISGSVGYTITSGLSYDAEVHLDFSSITSGSGMLSRVIKAGAGKTVSGIIDISGSLVNFASDPLNPFNRLPVLYSIYAEGDPIIVPLEVVEISISFSEPEFDYAKGYFGQHETATTEIRTFESGMDKLFSKLSGSIWVVNPSITVNYNNSFGIPLKAEADITGENEKESINLLLDPVDLDYPNSLTTRDISSSFIIDRDNSNLPEIVSMLPEQIFIGGSATSNIAGETGEDNIVFSDSRLIADIDIEVPFDFRINNLQLSDTTDNFLLDDDSGESILDMFTWLKIDFFIENGFPLGGDVKLSLYDSVNEIIVGEVGADEMFKPADVDATGRVVSPVVHNSSVELNSDFISAVQKADRIIFTFTLYTTNQGSKDVKIYSDYSIMFKAGLSFRANIQLD